MSIYLKLSDVQGSADAKGYENFIPLLDVDFGGVSVHAPLKIGHTVNQPTSIPHFAHVTLAKVMDKSSVKLFDAVHQAKLFPKAEIHYVTTSQPLMTYSKLVLSNSYINHYTEGYSEELEQPLEIISLSYSKIERTFVPRDKNNKAISSLTTGYDLTKATRL